MAKAETSWENRLFTNSLQYTYNTGFLRNVSILLIHKTDGFQPTKKENY